MLTRTVIVVSFLSFLVSAASADLSLCNGVWTNQPCDSQASATLEESEKAAPAPKPVVEKRQKSYALHELLMHQVRAKREHNIDIFVNDVIDVCRDPSIDRHKCSSLVAERYMKITSMIEEAKKNRAAEAAAQSDQKQQKSEPTQTVVVQPSRTVVVPVFERPRRRTYRRDSVSVAYDQNQGVSVDMERTHGRGTPEKSTDIKKDNKKARPLRTGSKSAGFKRHD